MPWQFYKLSLSGLFLGLVIGCGGFVPTFLPEEFRTLDLATTVPVLASAGADRQILWGYPARLDGLGTHHPQGAEFSVQWEQIGGEPVHLSNVASLNPSFLAPLSEQTLEFRIVADDGTWSTEDVVVLFVKQQPREVPPRVRAGADRFLEASESAEPKDDDTVEVIDAQGGALWEEIRPGVSRLAGDVDAQPTMHIFRLSAARDELHSDVDYMLLYPHEAGQAEQRAPSAVMPGYAEAQPDETLVLDASQSTDANGDSLSFRWQLVRGDVVSPDPVGITQMGAAQLNVAVAPRAQELVYRVYVRDAQLESAPTEVRIVVSGDPISAIEVAPQRERRAHPHNTVWLDARALTEGLPMTIPAGTHFVWQQTRGPMVKLLSEDSGQLAAFDTPEAVGVLGFSVVAMRE
ncbi:MAG: hypothetical protein R3C68_16845 [Myxococcota bacterium]